LANHVGVDLSNRQIRVLEAEGTAKKLKLKRFARAELGGNVAEGQSLLFLDKEVGKTIEQTFRNAKISREPTALSWDSDLTIFRELELPFTSDEQIRKVVKYEAEAHLHNCDIDDVVVSFYKLAEGKDKSHVMVMAVRKDQLLNRLEILGAAGVDPVVADLDVMAAFNALSALGYTTEHKSFMLLDCGRRTTNLLLVSGGRLIAGRAIRIGSDQLVKRIAADLEADPADVASQTQRLLMPTDEQTANDLIVTVRDAKGGEVDETKKLPVDLARDLATQRAGDFLQRITREVKRTLATADVPEGVEVIYVTGAGSRIPGFAASIASGLAAEVPVQQLSFLDRVDCALEPDEKADAELESLTALGLCFKLAGHDATGIDLRQEEAKYARKFDQVKEPLVYLGGLTLFFVLLLNLLDLRMLSLEIPFLVEPQKSKLAVVHGEAVKAYTSAFGGEKKLAGKQSEPGLPSMQFILGQLRTRVEELKGELGRGGSIPEHPSAFKMWKECFDAIAGGMNGIGKLYLDNLTINVKDIKRPTIEINGFVPNNSSYSDLVAALQSIPEVSVVEGTTAPKQVDGVELLNFAKLIVMYPERQDVK
jgi:type IV pilus assembly protein PilM